MRPFTITPPPCEDIIIPDGVQIGPPPPESRTPRGVKCTCDLAASWANPGSVAAKARRNRSQPKGQARCVVDGCGRIGVAGHGLCVRHYSRWRREGQPKLNDYIANTPSGDMRRKAKYCTVTGCTNLHRAKGMCSGHYTLWIYHGRPNRARFIQKQGRQKAKGKGQKAAPGSEATA